MTFKERYQYNPLTDLLGKGGFARVYKAYDTNLDIDVAVKFFNATEANAGKYTVYEEIKRAIKFNHPNVLRYFDAAILENTNSVGEREVIQIGIMELANAGDLKQFVRTHTGSSELIRLLKEVLSGLDYLHQRGLIHRDLKPQNILLTDHEGILTVKISDFGISKALDGSGISSSKSIGTIEYMAPEQFNPQKYAVNGEIGTNLDLWSFGVMVYELVAGEPLFGQRGGNTSAEQIMTSILAPELPGSIEKLPEPYRAVVKRCLVHQSADRVQRASELIPMLESTPPVASEIPAAVVPPILSEVPETLLMPKVSAQSTPPPVQVKEKKKASLRMPLLIGLILGFSGVMYWMYGRTDYAKGYTAALRQFEAGETDSSMATLSGMLSDITIKDSVLYRDVRGLMAKNLLKRGDTVKAIPYLETTASFRDGNSLLELGRLYYHGRHIKKDLKKAFDYFSRSADLGNATAMHNKAYGYLSGQGVNKNSAEALAWYQRAADKGEVFSMHSIGIMYLEGQGIKKDYAKALEWFLKGAEKKHTTSMIALANLYFYGRGVVKNDATMMEWYLKAADLGDAEAMLYIGVSYYEGNGARRDAKESIKWFQKSAELGNATSMAYLGYCYLTATGISKDLSKAMEWFRKAADKGNAYAMFSIGAMYEMGEHVKADKAIAKEWYKKACDAGDTNGCSYFKNMKG